MDTLSEFRRLNEDVIVSLHKLHVVGNARHVVNWAIFEIAELRNREKQLLQHCKEFTDWLDTLRG